MNTLTEKTAALDTTVTSIQNSFNSLEISFESVKQTVQDLVDKVNNLGDVFLKLDGTSTPTANITMGSHKVTNVASPTDNADAVNKEYVDGKVDSVIEKVDDLDSNYLRLDGTNSPSRDISWGNHGLIDVGYIYVTEIFDIDSKSHELLRSSMARGSKGDYFYHLATYGYTSGTLVSTFEMTTERAGDVIIKCFAGSTTAGEPKGKLLLYQSDVTNKDQVVTKRYADSLAPTAMTGTEVSEITALFA